MGQKKILSEITLHATEEFLHSLKLFSSLTNSATCPPVFLLEEHWLVTGNFRASRDVNIKAIKSPFDPLSGKSAASVLCRIFDTLNFTNL